MDCFLVGDIKSSLLITLKECVIIFPFLNTLSLFFSTFKTDQKTKNYQKSSLYVFRHLYINLKNSVKCIVEPCSFFLNQLTSNKSQTNQSSFNQPLKFALFKATCE